MHRGSASYICDRPLELGLRALRPLVQANIWIIDEASNTSSAWPHRNMLVK